MSDAFLRAPALSYPPGPEYADDLRRFQGIPSIERAPSGRLWASWYGGGDDEDRRNYILLNTSEDGGDTWSDLVLVIDPDGDGPVRASDSCLWHDPDGRLWLFWTQGLERHVDKRAGVWAIATRDSDSALPQWSEPVRLCDGVMMNKPTVLSSGEWLFPVALWGREGSAQVYTSSDRGSTWELRGASTVPEESDRRPDEHMIVERRDNSLWMLVRTRYGIGTSVSTDRGRRWTPAQPSPIPHTDSRFFVRRLRSGRLLLVKNGAIDEAVGRSRLTAFLSEDDGDSWIGGLLLDERELVSYPDGVEAPDGTLHVIYDRERKAAKEILAARFTEDDVIQGRCTSDSAGLRLLVNKAAGINPSVGS